MIGQGKARDVAEMEMTWFDEIEHQATPQAERRMLRRMLEARFGRLGADDLRRIDALDSTERIERVFDKALAASSLQDIDLDG